VLGIKIKSKIKYILIFLICTVLLFLTFSIVEAEAPKPDEINDSQSKVLESPIEVPKPTTEQIIANAFGSNSLMLLVAIAESELDPTAYNPEWHYDRNGNKICQGSYGLFQIACVNYSGDPKDLYDPELNIKLAKIILKSQGINAWGVCKTKINCYTN
jgi:hypothetical protein